MSYSNMKFACMMMKSTVINNCNAYTILVQYTMTKIDEQRSLFKAQIKFHIKEKTKFDKGSKTIPKIQT